MTCAMFWVAYKVLLFEKLSRLDFAIDLYGFCTVYLRLCYTAPFSFLFVFVDENAVRSHCFVFKWIRHENDRRSNCSSKTVLLIPSSKQCLLLAAVRKAPIASSNASFDWTNWSHYNALWFVMRILRLRSQCSVFVSIRFCRWKRCPFTLLRFQMNTLWKR